MDSDKVLAMIKKFLKIDLAEAYPNPAHPLDSFILLRIIEYIERAEDFDVDDIEELIGDFHESRAINNYSASELYVDILTPEILKHVDRRLDDLEGYEIT